MDEGAGSINSRFNYPINKWNKAKEEMRKILIEVAQRQDKITITYSDLVAKIHNITLEPNSYALANMLGEISSEEYDAGGPLLSAVVVHRYEPMEPGSGFFELAEDLGYDVSDKTKFWIDELKKVHEYWKGK